MPDPKNDEVVLSATEIADKLWAKFLLVVAIDTFGETAVLMEGKKIRNLLGSADSYKKLFNQAANELWDEEKGESNADHE